MTGECFWVYILLCENNTFYTGYTSDLQKRWQSHLLGTGRCRYTRSFKPVGIAQCWKIHGSRSLAMQIEARIKKLSRAGKQSLIDNPGMLTADYPVQCVHSDFCLEICHTPAQAFADTH